MPNPHIIFMMYDIIVIHDFKSNGLSSVCRCNPSLMVLIIHHSKSIYLLNALNVKYFFSEPRLDS